MHIIISCLSSVWMVALLMRLLALIVFWDMSWLQTWSGPFIYNRSLGKLLAPLYPSTKYLAPPDMLYLYKSWIKPRALLPYLRWRCPILSFQPQQCLKAFMQPCSWWIVFPSHSPFPLQKLLIHYFHRNLFWWTTFSSSTSSDLYN